jgi:hypothetical protein
MDNGSHHINFSTLEIEVPPLEAEQLALTKTRGRVHEDQDTGQWTHSAQKLSDLLNEKNVRYLATFGTLANKIDGIVVKEFLSAGMVKQHAHNVLDLRARGASQRKLP